MLDKARFLEIKNVAQMIRKENRDFFEGLKDSTLEEAIKEKEEFIEALVDNLNFSSGEKGKEEMQIFRANILIPDDKEFYETYSKDKNIRNLMNKYYVNIEDVMSKITELNIYGKYTSESLQDESKDFAYEMVKENTNDAFDLLDEIKALTDEMDEIFEDEDKLLEPEELDEEFELPKVEENETEDINKVVSSFVDNYTKMEEENIALKNEIKELKEKIMSFDEEKDALNKKIKEMSSDSLEKEKLQKELEEAKLLISKIYTCIAPKEN